MINVAYAGTRVIEVASTLSAGVTGRFFADLGADVVRVEAFEELARSSSRPTISSRPTGAGRRCDGSASVIVSRSSDSRDARGSSASLPRETPGRGSPDLAEVYHVPLAAPRDE